MAAAEGTSGGADGRAALVTGARSGLGAAAAELLATEGWRVAALDLTDSAPGELSLAADVSDDGAVRQAVERATETFGRLDAVVSCAGTFANTLSPCHLLDDEAWHRTLAVNLTGAFHVSRAALPHLMARGGSLVLVASVASSSPQPGGTAYSASKAGVAALARSIALEYASHDVQANSVSPGYMDTPMAAPALSRPGLRRSIEEGIPLGRVATPAEVARVVADLCARRYPFVTGQEITVDGGESLKAFVHPGEVARMWRRVAERRPGPE